MAGQQRADGKPGLGELTYHLPALPEETFRAPDAGVPPSAEASSAGPAPWVWPEALKPLQDGGLVEFLKRDQQDAVRGDRSSISPSRSLSPMGRSEDDGFLKTMTAMDKSLDFSSSVQELMAQVGEADVSHTQSISADPLTSATLRKPAGSVRFSPNFYG